METQVLRFLQRHGMWSGGISLTECTEGFLAQMQSGLAGGPSSLSMLRTYLRPEGVVPTGERAIVLDVGGTNLRSAVVCFTEQGPQVSDLISTVMPGKKEEIDCDTFFLELARRIADAPAEIATVGLCFSFQAEILPDRDARIIAFSKELRIRGGEGRIIGREINARLQGMGREEKRFVVLNDTAAVLFCGLTEDPERYGGHVGFILGTGSNSCYTERVSHIRGVGGEGSMVVNTESGCYDGIPAGDFDCALDAASQKPGDHLLEKKISGAYLGSLLWKEVRGAVAEGVFPGMTSLTAEEDDFAMAELSRFFLGQGRLMQRFPRAEDRRVLYALAEDLLERGARIAAVNLAALLRQGEYRGTPKRPVCIHAEGSTLEKSPLYRPKLEAYLRSYVQAELGLTCVLRGQEHATLVGTAAAALTQSRGWVF